MSEGGAATFRKITMDGIAGTSPIFEMINNDNEDTDAGIVTGKQDDPSMPCIENRHQLR